MIYFAWLYFLPVRWLTLALAFPAALVVAFFVDRDGNIPECLRWFCPPDSNMFGVGGDAGFARDYAHRLGTFWGRWYTAVRWQWRNKMQGFAVWELGVDETGLTISTVWESGTGDLKKYLKVAKNAAGEVLAFELKGSFKWPFIQKRFRFRLGWKIQWDEKFPAQYVFSVSFFMSVEE